MRIPILGGNGMIGHKMYQVLSKIYEDTWVLFKKRTDELTTVDLFNKDKIIDNFDLINLNKLQNTLDNLKPDIIINAAGITIRRGVNDNIYNTISINSLLPHFLDNWVKLNNKRLIHFSTDCVFSGKKGFYSESSLTDAEDTYGRTKALGEIISTNTLSLRGSMIGRELEYKTELLEWFLNQKEISIKGFSNVVYSGITTLRMAKYVHKIICDFPTMHGIYNVSSTSITKYELINLFNSLFKKGTMIYQDNSYTSNKELDSTKFFKETGFEKPNWKELAEELFIDSESNLKYYK
jgi:dTDP-4-dehydrorhamnose reductase